MKLKSNRPPRTRRSPASLPMPEFFGKYDGLMDQAYIEEQRRLSGNLTALVEILSKQDPQLKELLRTLPKATLDDSFGRQVEQWWPLRVLRRAAEGNDAEGCKRLLYFYLLELGIRLPAGVLIPFRWKPWRPNDTEAIYRAWIAENRPAVTWRVCDSLAKSFYPQEFAQAKSDPTRRKNLRDRIRATILRHERRLDATKALRVS
jgi:hypothetical protein